MGCGDSRLDRMQVLGCVARLFQAGQKLSSQYLGYQQTLQPPVEACRLWVEVEHSLPLNPLEHMTVVTNMQAAMSASRVAYESLELLQGT